MDNLDQIKEIRFKRSGLRGYNREEVNEFVSSVKDFVEKLVKKQNKLFDEMKSLKEELQKYKKDEEYLKETLVNAKRIAAEEIRKAEDKSKLMIIEAEEDREKIIADKQIEISKQEKILNQMKKEVADFKTRLLNEYKLHLRMISSIEKDEIELEKEKTFKSSDDKKVISEGNSKNEKEIKTDSASNFTSKEKEDKFRKLGGIKFGVDYDLKNDNQSSTGLFDN